MKIYYVLHEQYLHYLLKEECLEINYCELCP